MLNMKEVLAKMEDSDGRGLEQCPRDEGTCTLGTQDESICIAHVLHVYLRAGMSHWVAELLSQCPLTKQHHEEMRYSDGLYESKKRADVYADIVGSE